MQHLDLKKYKEIFEHKNNIHIFYFSLICSISKVFASGSKLFQELIFFAVVNINHNCIRGLYSLFNTDLQDI